MILGKDNSCTNPRKGAFAVRNGRILFNIGKEIKNNMGEKRAS